MAINWLKVGVGLYLISPISPEDIGTGGALVLPSAIVGSGIVLNGLGVLK